MRHPFIHFCLNVSCLPPFQFFSICPENPHRHQLIPRPMCQKPFRATISYLCPLTHHPFYLLTQWQIPRQPNHTTKPSTIPTYQPHKQTYRAPLTKPPNHNAVQRNLRLVGLSINQRTDILHTRHNPLLVIFLILVFGFIARAFRHRDGGERLRLVPGLAHGILAVRGVGEDPFQVGELGGGVKLVDEACWRLRWVLMLALDKVRVFAIKGLSKEAGTNRSSLAHHRRSRGGRLRLRTRRWWDF